MNSQSNNKIKIKQSNASKLRLTLGLSIILVWIVISFNMRSKMSKISFEWFEDLGPFAPVLFTIMLSFAVVILFQLYTEGRGWSDFSVLDSDFGKFVASVVGGLLAFLLGRWLFRDAISDIVASNDRLLRLEQAISEEAMQISI